VKECFESLLLKFGGLDFLVSNAGLAHVAAIDQLEVGDWEKSFAVNAKGHFLVAREALRILKRQGWADRFYLSSPKMFRHRARILGVQCVQSRAGPARARACD